MKTTQQTAANPKRGRKPFADRSNVVGQVALNLKLSTIQALGGKEEVQRIGMEAIEKRLAEIQ